MAKFGPLANIDSCAAVRGMLVRVMMHFCLLVLVFLAAVVGAEAVHAEVVGVLLLALDMVLEQLG